MRRSPRRPLILKRRKLPFQAKELSSKLLPDKVATQDAHQSTSSICIPDGVCIMDHPSMSTTQVVVVPKTADLQTVIGALTAKGKESGAQGPNKFILLSGNSGNSYGSCSNPSTHEKPVSSQPTNEQVNFHDVKHLSALKPLGKDLECGPLDESLTNIQWLGRMSASEPHPSKPNAHKENANPSQMLQSCNTEASLKQPLSERPPVSERPPYSYMAMIQFAINSKQSKKMTLKEIYTWIEDHFPFFRQVAKPGWKNSIRHNLSLHDMFIRETSADGKVSYWTIRPEANRCLTLDQVYKPDFDPQTVPCHPTMLFFHNQQQKKILPGGNKTSGNVLERKMKPLLPRTDSYLVPIQLPVSSTMYIPPSTSSAHQKRSNSCGAKKVRIAPKISVDDVPGFDMKEEVAEALINPTTNDVPRPIRSSRRKQCLVHSVHEEPVLLCHNNTFLDSGVVSDTSTFQDLPDVESNDQEKLSPNEELTYKTPMKNSNHMTSSTPSKAPSNMFSEHWKVTPVGKRSQTLLDFSPIRTPGGPAVTPRHDYTTYSFSSTPFKDLPLFNSPRELLTAPVSKPPDSPEDCPRYGCSRELLQASGPTPNNRSVTEGLVLDTMNDSLSKILVDISFSGLDDEDLGMANISWSEFIPQLK